MYNAAIMEKAQSSRHAAQPFQNFFHGHTVRIVLKRLVESATADILHDYPVVMVGILADVEDRYQILVLQIQAL